MEITVAVKGMTCGHCEGRVTQEISAIPGVVSVVASAEKANVIINSDSEIPFEAIDYAINEAGYSVEK
jgi:copper chaperone